MDLGLLFGCSVNAFLSESQPLVFQTDAQQVLIRRDIQSSTVIAKTAIAGGTVGQQSSEVCSGRVKDQKAPRARCIDIARLIHFQTIGNAGSVGDEFLRIEEDSRLAQCAVVLDIQGVPQGSLGIGLADVQSFVVRGKGNAVGPGNRLGQQSEVSIGLPTEHSRKVEVTLGVIVSVF